MKRIVSRLNATSPIARPAATMRNCSNYHSAITYSIDNSEWESVDKSPPNVSGDHASSLGVLCDTIKCLLNIINKCLAKAAPLRLVIVGRSREFFRSLRDERKLNHPILFRISAITSLAGRASVSPVS